jgi:REP-associated tyrosine transposase
MARQQRLIVPAMPVHIIQRGNDRMSCFRDDADRLVYLALLRQLTRKHECAIHAYCLMTNHMHLLLTPSYADACTELMHGISSRYAHYFNRKHGRTGTLWDGRFRSCLVESASYVLACYRYIELNPVRAGMVSDPAAYLWSSFAGNAGIRSDLLLTPHPEFRAVSLEDYRRLVADGLGEDFIRRIRAATHGGYPLASEEFAAALGAKANRRLHPGRPGRPRQEKSEPDPDLFSGDGAS